MAAAMEVLTLESGEWWMGNFAWSGVNGITKAVGQFGELEAKSSTSGRMAAYILYIALKPALKLALIGHRTLRDEAA